MLLSVLDEVGAYSWFVVGTGDAVLPTAGDALQKPCHVFSQGAHGLQAFGILSDVVGGEAMDGVPVLGGDDGHVGDGEILVELLKGGGGASASAGDDGGSEFARHAVFRGEEEAVEEGDELPARPAVVDRGADDEGVEFVQSFLDVGDDVVPEAIPGLHALHAGDAARDGMAPEVEHFRGDVVLLQGLFDFVQGGPGAAPLMGAAIDQQGYHARGSSVRMVSEFWL